jgi:hypothetical protein
MATSMCVCATGVCVCVSVSVRVESRVCAHSTQHTNTVCNVPSGRVVVMYVCTRPVHRSVLPWYSLTNKHVFHISFIYIDFVW